VFCASKMLDTNREATIGMTAAQVSFFKMLFSRYFIVSSPTQFRNRRSEYHSTPTSTCIGHDEM